MPPQPPHMSTEEPLCARLSPWITLKANPGEVLLLKAVAYPGAQVGLSDVSKRTRKCCCEGRPLCLPPCHFRSPGLHGQSEPGHIREVMGRRAPALPGCSQGADRLAKPSWTCQQPSPLSAPEVGEPPATLCLTLLTDWEMVFWFTACLLF